jgi:hypothetical protein
MTHAPCGFSDELFSVVSHIFHPILKSIIHYGSQSAPHEMLSFPPSITVETLPIKHQFFLKN